MVVNHRINAGFWSQPQVQRLSTSFRVDVSLDVSAGHRGTVGFSVVVPSGRLGVEMSELSRMADRIQSVTVSTVAQSKGV